MTELAKLTYSPPPTDTTQRDEDQKAEADLERLRAGIAFPYDHRPLEKTKSASSNGSDNPQRCKKCRKLECKGVGGILFSLS